MKMFKKAPSRCPACGTSYDGWLGHRFKRYVKPVFGNAYIRVECSRCGYMWKQPTKVEEWK